MFGTARIGKKLAPQQIHHLLHQLSAILRKIQLLYLLMALVVSIMERCPAHMMDLPKEKLLVQCPDPIDQFLLESPSALACISPLQWTFQGPLYRVLNLYKFLLFKLMLALHPRLKKSYHGLPGFPLKWSVQSAFLDLRLGIAYEFSLVAISSTSVIFSTFVWI